MWVMNVVPIDSPDTLPIIYERGLFGMYHDWCESFSTYPRSYDLLHADHLLSRLRKRSHSLFTKSTYRSQPSDISPSESEYSAYIRHYRPLISHPVSLLQVQATGCDGGG